MNLITRIIRRAWRRRRRDPVSVWEARHLRRLAVAADDAVTATREFLVTGVRSRARARDAAGVPREGERHPHDPSLIAGRPRAVRAGYRRFVVVVSYARPTLKVHRAMTIDWRLLALP